MKLGNLNYYFGNIELALPIKYKQVCFIGGHDARQSIQNLMDSDPLVKDVLSKFSIETLIQELESYCIELTENEKKDLNLIYSYVLWLWAGNLQDETKICIKLDNDLYFDPDTKTIVDHAVYFDCDNVDYDIEIPDDCYISIE